MKTKLTFLWLLILIFSATTALAIPTKITVRVKTKDAKFLGTSMGGAQINISDVFTGELLAKGRTVGTTGNTNRIMREPVSRGKPVSDKESAKFTASIDINEPRFIEITAYGPMANLQAANRASATQWVIPGKHITGGDAWVIELPGFVVDVQAPPTHIKLKGIPQAVKIETNVIMM